jgi:hypothetical protein
VTAAEAAGTPGWRVTHTVKAANSYLEDVVATSPTSAWATGESGAGTPVVYRWQRGVWRATARPGPKDSFAGQLSATSNSNVWVTLENEPVVDHWNGRRWVRTSFAAAQQILIAGVVAPAPHDTWVLTVNDVTRKATAEHYNGSTWTADPLPLQPDSGSYADAVSASSPSDIWAWAYDAATSAPIMLHYNGSAWRVVSLPAHLVPAGVSIVASKWTRCPAPTCGRPPTPTAVARLARSCCCTGPATRGTRSPAGCRPAV